MSRATTTVEGFLAGDGVMAFTKGGDAYLNLSIPHTPRKRNKQTGEWEDAGSTLWVRVTLWREAAEAFAEHAVKGTAVIATGEPVLTLFTTRSGEPGANLELKFATVSIVPRAPRAQNGGQGARNTPPATDEPWSTPNGAQADAWTTPGSFGDDTPF